MNRWIGLGLFVVAMFGCTEAPVGDIDAGDSDAGTVVTEDDAAIAEGDGGMNVEDDGGAIDDDAGTDAGMPSTGCATEDGRLGPPEIVFEIPRSEIEAGGVLFLRDVQDTFPDVDWSRLDRLYIPAGEYTRVYIGNLPQRSAERPLVITNRGGQVFVSGGEHGLALVGGSHWIFTGRYDPIDETGDAMFPGHRGCDYAGSRGRYGVHVDSQHAPDVNSFTVRSPQSWEAAYRMNRASDFELEYLEIERAGFAGLMIKSDNQADMTMENVRVHDLYIHDTISEGAYVGSTSSSMPQHQLRNFDFYENRIVRTGTECAQFGQLGEGSDVHHNVFALCAMDWRDAFQAFQDNGVQFAVREGPASFHHNIVIGAGDNLLSLFNQPRSGDTHAPGDAVLFHDNYLASTRNGAIWLHEDSDGVTAFRFERMSFRSMVFQRDEVYDSASPLTSIFRSSNTETAITFADFVWDSDTVPVSRASSRPSSNVHIESSTRDGDVPPVVFRQLFDLPADVSYQDIELWTDTARRAGSPAPAVTYVPGDYVVHEGVLYECLRSSTRETPQDHPAAWRRIGVPVDDVRLAPDSPHRGIGLGAE